MEFVRTKLELIFEQSWLPFNSSFGVAHSTSIETDSKLQRPSHTHAHAHAHTHINVLPVCVRVHVLRVGQCGNELGMSV